MVLNVGIVAALLVLHGVLAGSEIAVVSLRKTRLRQLVDAGRAGAVDALRRHPERFLATVQVFITIIGTLISSRGTPTFQAILRPALDAVGIPPAFAEGIAYAGGVAIISFSLLVVGALVPKSLALRASEPYALIVGRPLLFLSSVARPVVWLLEASSNVFLRLFDDKTSFMESRLSPEEIAQLLEEAGRTGSLDARASDIAVRAIAFEGLTAADVMVPRNRVVTISKAATVDELKKVFLSENHQRVPVTQEDRPDDIVGYVAARDLLTASLTGVAVNMDELMRPAKFFPESMKATDVLKDLQAARAQMAIVVDELGGMAGLLTMEDLLEELVGEIWSEGERSVPSPMRTMRDGSALVLGAVPIRDVNRALNINLPEGDLWTTLAGYCIALSGRIPESGARLVAEDGTILEIMESSARRVRSVWVVPKRAGVSVPPKRADGAASLRPTNVPAGAFGDDSGKTEPT
jgi:putative hemolysin